MIHYQGRKIPNGKSKKIPPPQNHLFDVVAALDKSRLRKVTDRVRPSIAPKVDERDSLLEQTRTKSFNLRPAVVTRPNIQGPKTNLKDISVIRKPMQDGQNKWVVTKFVKEHSHSTETYALRQPIQKKTLGRDAQSLLEYFKKVQAENLGFFYVIQLDEDDRVSNVFWADARSRTAYSHFGDAVTLDTTHRANQYNVPYAPFTGINHHGQMILFGCALIFDDSEASFGWLFKTFLAAMNERHPLSITTDQDRSMKPC
ncbi:hypothetical protein KIW84_030188 [Lathyrus oleraceus]|uniref:Protein FAR1-RELATED SEQUENCE n=1 Tax=Pisum sativum TaxID=3888 RepID=A0A9D4XM86_PEA|nr:hypothetical protein KIW84_030188 [Pisum sativum]